MSKKNEYVVSLETVDVSFERPRFDKIKKRVMAHDTEEAELTARSLVRAANKSVRVVAVPRIMKIESEERANG